MPLKTINQNEIPEEPPAKRLKTGNSSTTPIVNEAIDSAEPETQEILDSGLDQTLPSEATVSESEAVQKYEQSRGSGGVYTSSIYVDAFNLALDTVLKDEAYLFSEDETEVFAKYSSLEYEAKHLYVRLFLRKTNAWFRIAKLQYPKDITDIDTACGVLQSEEVGFADTDKEITLEDVAGLLSLEELRVVAKDAKSSGGGGNKVQLIAGLKKASKGQCGLQKSIGGQLKLKFDTRGNYVDREGHFVKIILEKIGPCIRLSAPVTALFNRVHLVFYRSTEWTEKSLTTVILSRTMKRNFSHYIVSRTSNIFPTRQSLLDFEASIKIQSSVDEILESGVTTDEGLKKVRNIFDDTYPLWETLVKEEAEKTRTAEKHDEAMERVYLRRFNAAWVYTRIIHKGVYVLGRFKEYEREREVLEALLDQRFFQSARRGGANTLPNPPKKEALVKKWRQTALRTCEAGLQDPQTHIIFHHDLQKRILKLEQKLRIPKRDHHDFGHALLRKPSERTIFGERLNAPELGKKTLWRDPGDAEGKGECSVEEMCLSVYRSEDWKGFHSEGGIVRTLFAYLFYDILFLYLPNVFETEFQTCPLDLFTDAFYPARASEINHRLVEIGNGDAPRIVRGVWERERERGTCVVGLDWGYEIEDLEEICHCFPPEGLSVICKVLCQEYRQRGSGVPDLFLWRVREGGEGECLFSEVKSENDRLSDTQRLWIHVLSSAGVRVELCAARSKKKEEVKED
ncbi:VRR-NUC domain-containing protein [Trichophaea hybrida]|nr:VRR-NUC domain-containing protein [Trichophaea hybrida]